MDIGTYTGHLFHQCSLISVDRFSQSFFPLGEAPAFLNQEDAKSTGFGVEWSSSASSTFAAV